MEGELLDWEMVHGSDTESTDSITSNKKKSASSSVIDDGMMILSDHLSAGNIPDDATTDQSQYGVMESGDSLRVAYGSEPPNPVEVLGFDQLNVNQSGDDSVGNQLGFCDDKTGISSDGEVRVSDFEADDDEKHVESEAVAELTGEILSHNEDPSKCLSGSDNLEVADGSQSDVEEQIEDSSKSWFDSGVSELVSGVVNGEEEIVSDSGVASTEAIEGSEGNTVQAVAVNSGDESKSRETVWWKMPFVLLKYSAFRIGPVWSVSMAAAVMGIVLLGRRLYNMKKKAQRFHLKVSIDDKKVSRVMSQAARLNEVFTEVRRVPVIRPALPSPGAWPVLSLR